MALHDFHYCSLLMRSRKPTKFSPSADTPAGLLFASNSLLEAWSVYIDLTENSISCALLGPEGLLGVFWFSEETLSAVKQLNLDTH